MRRCCDFGDLRSGSIGGCGNGYDLGRGLWYPAILGNGEIILLVVDNQVSIRFSAFSIQHSIPDLRFLKKCSPKCILSIIGCLTQWKIILIGIDERGTDIKVKASIGKCYVHRRTSTSGVANYK